MILLLRHTDLLCNLPPALLWENSKEKGGFLHFTQYVLMHDCRAVLVLHWQ